MVRSARWGRRSFLKGAGVLSLGLAGCLSQDGESNAPGTDNTTGNSTPSGSPTGTAQATPGEQKGEPTDTPEEPTDTSNEEDLSWARNRGTLIDTFSDFDEQWEVLDGKAKRSTKTAFSGKESVLLDTSGASRVRISRQFETSMDFRNKDVSLAVKPMESTNGYISVAVQFRGLFGGTRSVSGYVNTNVEDRWMRLDLGVDNDDGVNMRAIKEMYIYCYDGQDASSKFYVDDLRIIDKPEKGVVMFNFEGGSKKDYTVARPVLGKRGWTGTLFAASDELEGGEAPTVGQYREMQNKGWVVGGYTVGRQKLTDYSVGDQKIIFAENKRQLEEKGLAGEFLPFVPPYGAYNTQTLDLVRDYFDSMYVYAGRSLGAATTVTDPRTIGVVSGEDMEKAKAAVDAAANYKQMAALSIRMDQVDNGHLEELCNYVQKAVNRGDVEVLNTAEHFEKYGRREQNSN
jgi:hypothetical protein